MSFELPKLNYSYSALEPYIDAQTVEVHYSKHHQGYTNNLNNAVGGSELEGKTIEEILNGVSAQSVAVRNNGGGFYNHNLYWDVLTPGGANRPEGDLLKAIENDFGSFDQFVDNFAKAAATRFGSGWAWLVKQGDKLVVSSTPNQDNPLMDVADVQGTPVLGIDVWEHAYYLKYQNRRPEYINAFMQAVNWDIVNDYYKK
ncbi:superoxide dismutase [Prolixibacteraceae bacterium JC049]|nr:superoxide dismutase [Prolixibacteraceae bacterium JC049]